MLKTGRIVYVVLLLQLTYFKSFSQDENKSQAVYLEVGGSGVSLSMNYDTRFTSKANGWGGRIGVGYLGDFFGGITVPLVINYLVGEKKDFLEIGAGATYHDSSVIGTLPIGYRRVSDSGFTFRAGMALIYGDASLLFWPQVSLGHSF